MTSAILFLLASEASIHLLLQDRGHHGAAGVGIFLGEFQRGAQHLLRVVLPDVLGGGGGDADAVHDGAVAPRLAHAEAIHVARRAYWPPSAAAAR
jgi:hypothetical protein